VVDPRENDLLVRIKNDDRLAVKILFEKYHSPLCSIAFRFSKDRDIAKDIVQDVFVKFWANRKSIQITSSLAAYLKRSVINTALNQIEKDQRYSQVELGNLSNHPIASSSEEAFSLEELSGQLQKAINALPFRTRAVFLLIRNEEMSYKEVAEALDISLKAVEKEMMKALRLLRQMLKNYLPLLLAGLSIW
jgi:RNA polymerase sigma-70 factor, ECF subfamily